MAITKPAGFPLSKTGAGLSTISVSPVTVGDLLILATKINSTTLTPTAVAGGGVTTWEKVVSFTDATDSRGLSLWVGQVKTTGTSTITVTWNESVGAVESELVSDSMTAGLGKHPWHIDVSGQLQGGSASLETIPLPTLTPTGPVGAVGEAYWGYVRTAVTTEAGSTSGFTYVKTEQGDMICYDLSVNAGTEYKPTVHTASKANYDGIAIVVWAVSFMAVADLITVSSSAVIAGAHPRTTSDSVTVSDSSTSASQAARSASDTIAISDGISRQAGEQRTAADSVALSDSIERATAHNRTTADSVSVGDGLGRTVSNPRTVTDSLTITDIASSSLVVARIISDTILLSEAIIRGLALSRTCSDALSVSDTASSAFVYRAHPPSFANIVDPSARATITLYKSSATVASYTSNAVISGYGSGAMIVTYQSAAAIAGYASDAETEPYESAAAWANYD